MIKLELTQLDQQSVVEVAENGDFLLTLDLKEITQSSFNREVNFNFTQDNTKADIFIRLVVDKPLNVDIRLNIIVPPDVKGVKSKLDMRGLLVDQRGSIRFVPMLEINEKEVSVDHKSTVGSPLKAWIDYLQSRGLTLDQANLLLKDAFLKL